MIKVENVSVFNFENSIRGMRNPFESWDKSDSYWRDGKFVIGENDLELALTLVKAGSDHRKFLRQIIVSVDITAPLLWWKEMDTYKVSTTANSCSTMHKIGTRFLTPEDFSWNKPTKYRTKTLQHLNSLIELWQKTKDKDVWREIIEDLPSSYNQMRTWTGNYENLRNIYHSRKNHKLEEWHEFCRVIESLPYSELITIN